VPRRLRDEGRHACTCSLINTKRDFNTGVNGLWRLEARNLRLEEKKDPSDMLPAMSLRPKRRKHGGYSPKNAEHRHCAGYVRFIVSDIDSNSQRELGVFQAIAQLRKTGRLEAHEEEEDERLGKWFDENLRKPTRFTASKPPYYRRQSKAISWFKDSAHEHIAQIRSLVAILEHHGVHVRMIATDRVGYVVYEDDYQVVAEPFAGEQY
jgi:hypothetical protein